MRKVEITAMIQPYMAQHFEPHEVSGFEFSVPELPGFLFIVYRRLLIHNGEVSQMKYWQVCEKTTGMAVSQGECKTKADEIAAAIERLKNMKVLFLDIMNGGEYEKINA